MPEIAAVEFKYSVSAVCFELNPTVLTWDSEILEKLSL